MAERIVTAQRSIDVEVAYALPHRQCVEKLRLPSGSTVQQAIDATALSQQFPGIGSQPDAVGIFGRVVPLTTILKAGDRVEIYRSLLSDPKQLRRARAGQAKVKKR